MTRLLLAAVAALAIVTPVLAQDAKPGATTLPANTFFKGQTSAQVLGKEGLLGAKVAGKDNANLGTVEDVIVSGAQLEGLIINVGDKKVGVRIGAVKMTTTDGKLTIAMPAVTPEMMKSVGAYERGNAAAKK